MIEVSRPLHFGNYGGLLLKSLWVVLDLTAIIVMATGFYLWFSRKADRSFRSESLRRSEAAP